MNIGVSIRRRRFIDLLPTSLGPAFIGEAEDLFQLFIRSTLTMIYSFMLASNLDVVSYLLESYFVKVAIYTGMTKVVAMFVACWMCVYNIK